MARRRVNLADGRLGQSLTPGATTLHFLDVPAELPTIASPERLAITIDDREIVHVTAYTAGATSATVERAQEGTAAVSHGVGVPWVHGPTTKDFEESEIVNTIDTVAATGPTHDIAFDISAHVLTMDEDCTFSFVNAVEGRVCSTTVLLDGSFMPTWSGVQWPNATPPVHASPAVYVFLTFDGGATVIGFPSGLGIG